MVPSSKKGPLSKSNAPSSNAVPTSNVAPSLNVDLDTLDSSALIWDEADHEYLYSLSELEREAIFRQRFENLKRQQEMGLAMNYAAQLEEDLQRVQLPGGGDKTITDEYFDYMINEYEDENGIGIEEGNEESSTAVEEDESDKHPPPDSELQHRDYGGDVEELGSQKKQPQPRRRDPPKTTGRKNIDNKRLKIAIRRRVSMQRFQLYHILSNDKQRACIPKGVPNNYSFFGTVVSRGNGRSNWNVRFDVLPCDGNVVANISRGKLAVVQPGEEELPLNARDQERFDQLGYDVTEEVERSPKKNSNKTLEEAFCSMEAKELKEASLFKYCWGDGDDECLEWRIIPDAVWLHDHNDPLVYPDKMELHDPSIQENELADPAHVFFQYIFPNIVGKI